MTNLPNHAPTSLAARDVAAAVTRVARALAHELSPGELAALRRLAPHDLSAPAFYRALVAYVEPHYSFPASAAARDEVERRGAVILAGMARLEHRPGRPLGHALAAAGLTEMRFLRLLRDSGPTLAATFRGVVHFLAAKNQTFDWVEGANLVLSEGQDWGETVRRDLARHYYSRSRRRESEKGEQT